MVDVVVFVIVLLVSLLYAVVVNKRAKPWPGVANRHRGEAMDQAGDIVGLCGEVKRALREHNYDLSLALVVAVEKSAEMIVSVLASAPASDGDDGG